MIHPNAMTRIAVALIGLDRQNQARPLKHRKAKDHVPLGLLEWTLVNRRYLRPGEKFSLKDHIYQKEIYKDTSRRKGCMKASQLGLTDILLSLGIHMNIERHGDVLFLMPTIHDVSDFSRSRLNTAIEASPYIAGKVRSGIGGKRGADTISLKRFDENFFYMRGAMVNQDGNARQLKSIPVDLVMFDELDEMDERAHPIAVQRLNHSPIKEEFYNSTPTFHNFGIHKIWEVSDQREWFVPCPHCGERQQLLLENCVLERDELNRPVDWHGRAEERAWIACINCVREMDRGIEGEWVSTYPGRLITCWHPTQLMAPHVPLLDIIQDLQDISEKKRQETYNQRLGIPYTPKGGRLTADNLDACHADYTHGPVADAGAVMGVDVGSVLHVIIRSRPDENGRRRQLFAGFVTEFSDVKLLVERYEVVTCVVDEGPETRAARDFQKSLPRGVVWLCHYLTGDAEAAHNTPVQWDHRDSSCNAARTWTLDLTMARFYDKTNTIPQSEQRGSEYYKHMTAPVRVIKERKSDKKPLAIYINETRDHLAHAENYCTIAGMRPVGWAR